MVMVGSEVLMRIQYFDITWRRQLTPEQRLMLELLADAVYLFQTCSRKKSRRAKNQFQEVKHWIFEERTARIHSFETICVVLGLDPNYIRKGLRNWLEDLEDNSLL